MRGLLIFLCGCGTLADRGGGETSLPNAQAGPFREIRQTELGNARVAPLALRDDEEFARDLSVVDVDGDPTTLEAWGYAAHTLLPEGEDPDATAPPNAILRYHALDGRSFARTADLVLEASEGWEGGTVGAPSALRVDDQVWLYYQGAEGIGLARDSERIVVLGPDPSGWESGKPPQSPAVLNLADGSFHMFYVVGDAIGEARSPDGVSWERTGAMIAKGRAPCAVLGTSATGRAIEYLYYQRSDGDVGMAARYDYDGAFSHAAAPVFAGSEPWVMRYPSFTLIFATQRAGNSEALNYPAVAIGVAPATIELPPLEPR